jgi:hypothetical protein
MTRESPGFVKIEGDWGRLSGESEQWVNLNYGIYGRAITGELVSQLL